MSAKPFIDTNIIVYAFATGERRRERSADLLASGGIVSVQVLNEFVNVSRKKRRREWRDILAELKVLDQAVDVVSLTPETHRGAVDLATRFDLSFYDSLIVSAARQAGCRLLYTEDLQHGQLIDGVRITNPFLAAD